MLYHPQNILESQRCIYFAKALKRNNDVIKMYNALQFGREHRESTWHKFDNCANCASRWAAESSSVAALVTEERRQILL